MLFRKSKKYQMDMDTANAALQNILASCDKAPNTIPFDKLVLRQKANTKTYNKLIVITAIILFFTFVAPLVVVPIATYTEKIFPSEPVTLVNNYVEDDILYLEFSKDNIRYNECYMETLSGERTEILSFDSARGLICFPYDTTHEVNIYIPLKDDSILHFVLIPQE